MSAASFTIFWMKIKLEKHSIIYCSIGAFFGMIFGLEVLDTIPAQAKKLGFVSIWFSFCAALFLLNRYFNLHSTYLHNSILLHSGLNPALHFLMTRRLSCCQKMKSVENILGNILGQFYRFSRGCKPSENLWNCSRKYTKMFKTDSFLGNKIIYKVRVF